MASKCCEWNLKKRAVYIDGPFMAICGNAPSKVNGVNIELYPDTRITIRCFESPILSRKAHNINLILIYIVLCMPVPTPTSTSSHQFGM